MTDLHDGSASRPNDGPASPLAQLADLHSPKRPEGSVGVLLNRMLIYARPDQVPALRPHVNLERSGFIIAGTKTNGRSPLPVAHHRTRAGAVSSLDRTGRP